MSNFRDYTCTVYSMASLDNRGSLTDEKTAVYTNIPCALWEKNPRLDNNRLASESPSSRYELNFDAVYTDIEVGYLVNVSWVWGLKVEEVIKHNNIKGVLDNLQVLASVTTTADDS